MGQLSPWRRWEISVPSLQGLPAGLGAGRSKAGCALASNCDCHTFVFQFVLFEMRTCMTTVSSL